MKILVTGANGYIGQGIVKTLLDMGHEIIATDFNVDNIDERATKIACNLFDGENPYQFFGNPDCLLHLAWRDGFSHYSDSHINDLANHYKFISKFSESEIKTIAVMGSMHEIGFYEGSINENTPCHPTTPYGIAKNALRELVFMLSQKHKINYQWLRGYYIVGNSEYGSSIFSKITHAAKKGDTSFPFTTGQNQYDFIDYDQFCYQVSCCITQDKINGIINICSGRPEKLADRVERFIKDNGYSIRLQYGQFPDRDYDSKAIWGDCSKINKIVNEQRKG